MMKSSKTVVASLILGYAFLYIPISLLVVYSFNESRLVTVWSRFSLKWYAALWENEELFMATLASLRIACVSASVSVVLGTLAAVAMVRFRKFRGRSLFSVLMPAPLVLPEVITGLSLLMMFVTLEQWIGWPSERGILTVTIAHITVSMAYVYLIVQSRLIDFDPLLEEAALDLGARPAKVFFTVTLPLIAPSLMAGWLLSFALSLDDLVVASFLSGPGATTLPMLIFSSVRLGLTPEINALATLIIALVATVIIISGIIIHKKNVKQRWGE